MTWGDEKTTGEESVVWEIRKIAKPRAALLAGEELFDGVDG